MSDAGLPLTVVVTGMSGSGKSTAIHALEDLGYYCVDNLPVALLSEFIALGEKEGIGRLAVGVDARERGFLAGASAKIDALRDAGRDLRVLFLDAEDDVLLRRFSETRRRHPLSANREQRNLQVAIAAERAQMESLRARASTVIDTTETNPHALRRAMRQRYGAEGASLRMAITVLSFGFKYGAPASADLIMDLRFLPNPYFVEELRELDGLDSRVASWVMEGPGQARTIIEQYGALLLSLLPRYEDEGKSYLTVAFGCTGGRHRSVTSAEAVADLFRIAGYDPDVVHRDRGKG